MNTPDPNNEAATPLVDFEQFNSACDGSIDMMRELVEIYFQQAGEIMPALEKAIAAGTIAQVNHLSHKLAGSSLACGFSAIVPPLRQLEQNAKAGHLTGAPEFFAQATVRLAAIQCQVLDYLNQPPPSAG